MISFTILLCLHSEELYKFLLHTIQSFSSDSVKYSLFSLPCQAIPNFKGKTFSNMFMRSKRGLITKTWLLLCFLKRSPVGIGCQFGWLPSVPTSHPLHCWKWSKPSQPPECCKQKRQMLIKTRTWSLEKQFTYSYILDRRVWISFLFKVSMHCIFSTIKGQIYFI